MKIQFSVPVELTLSSPRKQLLEFATNFVHQSFDVFFEFSGGDCWELQDSAGSETLYFRHLDHLVFTVSEVDPANKELEQLVLASDKSALIAVLVSLVNRVLVAIRNFGYVAQLHEIRPEKRRPESLLRSWDIARVGSDGEIIPLISPPSGLRTALIEMLSVNPLRPHLRVTDWDSIDVAIRDSLAPGPEHEFMTNAIEHIQVGNLRLALIEAVIGFEVILSDYLREYLGRVKGFSKTRIKSVLSHRLGLAARINVLAPLVFSTQQTNILDLDVISKAIKWRNEAVHETGHLPSDIPADEIRKAILALILGCMQLAGFRYALTLSDDLRKIQDEIVATGNPRPQIVPYKNHRFTAKIDFSPFQDFPPFTRLCEIAACVCEKLKQFDPQFVPEEHLTVSFFQSTKLIAKWDKGNLQEVEKPDAAIDLSWLTKYSRPDAKPISSD